MSMIHVTGACGAQDADGEEQDVGRAGRRKMFKVGIVLYAHGCLSPHSCLSHQVHPLKAIWQ